MVGAHAEEPFFHQLGGFIGFRGVSGQAGGHGLQYGGQRLAFHAVDIFNHGRQQHSQAQTVGQVRIDAGKRMFQSVRIVQHAVVKGDTRNQSRIRQEIARLHGV